MSTGRQVDAEIEPEIHPFPAEVPIVARRRRAAGQG